MLLKIHSYKNYTSKYKKFNNSKSAKPAVTRPNLRLCFIKKPTTGLDYKNFDRDAKLVFNSKYVLIRIESGALYFFTYHFQQVLAF